MVDKKTTQLDENSSPIGTDIIEIVDDPGGSPKSEKITLTNFFDTALVTPAVGAASTSVAGKSEFATTAEIDAGTDPSRVMAVDNFVASDFGLFYFQDKVFDFTTNIAIGDSKYYFHVPAGLDGWDLVEVHAQAILAGTTGTTDIQIRNNSQGVDMLSTLLTIDSGESGSHTAATPAVIDTVNDDVNENNVIRVDVDAVSTTPPKGLIITLGFRKP